MTLVGRPVRQNWSRQAAFIAVGLQKFDRQQKILMANRVRVQWNGQQVLAVPIGRTPSGAWRVRVLQAVGRGLPGTILTVPDISLIGVVPNRATPKQETKMADPLKPEVPDVKPAPKPGPKFPFLESLAHTIDRIGFDMEAEAKKLVESQVPMIQAKQKLVMDKARTRFGERVAALDGLSELLDKVNESLGGNSSDRPTSES